MSPDRVSGNIWNISPDERITNCQGDIVVIGPEYGIRIEYFNDPTIALIQTTDGRKIEVSAALFPEMDN